MSSRRVASSSCSSGFVTVTAPEEEEKEKNGPYVPQP